MFNDHASLNMEERQNRIFVFINILLEDHLSGVLSW